MRRGGGGMDEVKNWWKGGVFVLRMRTHQAYAVHHYVRDVSNRPWLLGRCSLASRHDPRGMGIIAKDRGDGGADFCPFSSSFRQASVGTAAGPERSLEIRVRRRGGETSVEAATVVVTTTMPMADPHSSTSWVGRFSPLFLPLSHLLW